jgi:hypothetical protein
MSFFALLADILYVGHSLVGPSLPAMVEAGLRHQGTPAVVEAQVINGAPLRFSWDNSVDGENFDARAVLPKGQTSVLILAEATPLASQVQWNDSAGQVAKFAEAAWQARPDTQVYIYETWHSLKSGPSTEIDGDPGANVPWRERLTADLPLWEALTVKANANRPKTAPLTRVIPAGQAMAQLADAIGRGEVPGITAIDQLFDDDIHPDGRALYFIAIVHIAVISGKSPVGLPPKLTRQWLSRSAVITDAQAAAFQRIAWATVQDYRKDDEARIATLAQSAAAGPAPQAIPIQAAPVETRAAVTPVQTPAIATLPLGDPPRGVTNPKLSLGLAGISDWSVQQPFLDVMKTARPWFGHLPGRWGGYEFDALQAGGHLDAALWPRRIPAEVTGLSTLFLTDLPADAGFVAGRYVLRYTGRGELRLEGRAQTVEAAAGHIVFDYTPDEGGVILTLTATDTADPIRNITVVKQAHESALAAGAIFNPDWLNRIRGTRAVRFMDWMATNNSVLSALENRPKPGDFSYAVNGVPIEVMLALANELRADPWFTLPHLADDALVRAYAVAVRDGLAPGLRAHIEYSNEVWNWQFDQARWADEQCRARWQAQDCWVQFYALRAAEVAQIWADVFGDQAKERLVRVIATQTGWLGLEDQILSAPLVTAEGRSAASDSFDAYAVTGYFAASLGAPEKLDIVRGWIKDSADLARTHTTQQGLTGDAASNYMSEHRFDFATDKAAIELENGFVTGKPEDTLMALLTTVLPYHAGVAQKHGMRLMMYEGGTHVVGLGVLADDTVLTEFFQHLNYSPQMGELYQRLLAGWATITDAPFNAFVDVYAPSKWGSWGALRHLGDDNPRWQALAHGCQAC